MRHLRKINESLDAKTFKVLDDFGVSEPEYLKMIEFIGKLGYTEVKSALPFLITMYDRNDFSIGYDNFKKLLNFYEIKSKEREELEKAEDFFLDLIEDKSNIKIEFDRNQKLMFAYITYDNLTEISDSLKEIERRITRSQKKYKIVDIINDGKFDTYKEKDINYLVVKVKFM